MSIGITLETTRSIIQLQLVSCPLRTAQDILVIEVRSRSETLIVILTRVTSLCTISSIQAVRISRALIGIDKSQSCISCLLPPGYIICNIVECRSTIEQSSRLQGINCSTIDASPVLVLITITERECTTLDDSITLISYPLQSLSGWSTGKCASLSLGQHMVFDRTSTEVANQIEVKDGTDKACLSLVAVVEMIIITRLFGITNYAFTNL